jgi:hypothetical protein
MNTLNAYPMLSERSRGWLKYLHRKATTSDDWDRGGHPSEMWDDKSTPPMLCFARFDLIDSSFVMALMAETTPAWREVYGSILDQLLMRYGTYWGAIDWQTQIGHDPQRGTYPEAWNRLYIPADRVGHYDVPGWTANGIEPWGLQMDPIGADGNLFYKGFFNLLLGLYRYMSGDTKWSRPFTIIGDGPNTFTYTHSSINHLLTRQWAARREGCHCENTKIWPYCLSAAGLGLQLHDRLSQTETHWVFDRWWKYAKEHYVRLPETGPLEWAAWYYDPLIDYLCQGGSAAAGSLVFFLSPQHYADAQRLYDGSVYPLPQHPDPAIRSRMLADPRSFAVGLLNARELGDTARYQALHALAEQFCEPTWDHERGEFYYRFGLSEPYPRGQANAVMMAAEAGGQQAWWRIFNEPNLRKFDQPTVCGVDFPRLGISQAIYDEGKEVLAVSTYAADPWLAGTATTFTVEHLCEPAQARVLRDGSVYTEWRISGETSIELKAEVQDHAYLVLHA